MFKKLVSLTSALTASLMVYINVFAEPSDQAGTSGTSIPILNNLAKLINAIGGYVTGAAVAVCVIMTVFYLIQAMALSDDSEAAAKKKKARNTAIIGVIAFCAGMIITWLANFLKTGN
jgi:hypothetical protein